MNISRSIVAIAAAKVALNLAVAGRYGYFRDELYYIACSDHLAWGYVDHPPLSIFILAITRRFFGDSLYGLRLPAALAGAAVVVLTALIAKRLGGGGFAQVLAAVAAAVSPIVLANAGRYFSMNAFDLLFWTAAAYVLVQILSASDADPGSPRSTIPTPVTAARADPALAGLSSRRSNWWIVFGIIAGLGVLNKYSMLFFGAGVFAGLLLTPARREFLRPGIWIGAAIAAVIVLPHAIWEARHGFPSIEFIRNATTMKNVAMSPGEFLAGQVMETGIGQTLLWLLGIGFFAVGRATPRLRTFAWCYVVVLAIMLAGQSKPYYLTPIYFAYVAAGAVWLEALAHRPQMYWIAPVSFAVVIVFSLIALPFAIPVLPVNRFIAYERALGQMPKAEERLPVGDLPQSYADMFGWDDTVAKVAAVYRSLTPDEQRHCVIYARNYGEAAAIDFFGRRYGLPRATCAHNSYWYWGSGVEPMKAAIIFGAYADPDASLLDLQPHFDSVRLAATTDCGHCMPFENHRAIFLCRRPHFTFRAIWPRERFFI